MAKIQVSVESLEPTQFKGWATKQGGSWKSWKKRYFVLKDRKLWYFESPKSNTAKGWIDLPQGTVVTDESERPKKLQFSISSSGVKGLRTFHLVVENEEIFNNFYSALNSVLGSLEDKIVKQDTKVEMITFTDKINTQSSMDNIKLLRDYFTWLNEGQTSSLLDLATNFLPPIDDLYFELSVSSDTKCINLKIVGEQEIMLQSLIDMFWAVGTSNKEFDKLNEIGTKIDPKNLGIWLDLSSNGGMDGGWYMLTNHTPSIIDLVNDDGKSTRTLNTLLMKLKIPSVRYVGRDLGVTPPKQCEFRFLVNGAERIAIIKEVYTQLHVGGYCAALEDAIKNAPKQRVLMTVKVTDSSIVKFVHFNSTICIILIV